VPNSSIKNEKMYRDLREEGNSKEKAARISNAAANRGAALCRQRWSQEDRELRIRRFARAASLEQGAQLISHVAAKS